LGDFWDAYKGGGLLAFELQKGAMGLHLGVTYGALDKREDAGFSALAFNGRLPLREEIRCGIVDLEGCYRFGTDPVSFEARAGLRYLHAGGNFRVASGYGDVDKTFFEPVVTGLFHVRLCDKCSLSARLGLSGFGVGSQLTADFEPRIAYDLSKSASVYLGYRILRAQYGMRVGSLISFGVLKSPIPTVIYERYGIDVAYMAQGPTIGFSFRW
jgi:hypothetical protein